MRLVLWLAMLPLPVWGQYTLYTCMGTSKDYVVGAKLPPSGIFLKSAAGEWRHGVDPWRHRQRSGTWHGRGLHQGDLPRGIEHRGVHDHGAGADPAARRPLD